MVKCVGTPLEGEGNVKIRRDSMYDGPMKTVEYMWANIWCMLDWSIGFCHKAAKIHFLGISCSTSE